MSGPGWPKSKGETVRLVLRCCLMFLFVFVAIGAMFQVGVPRPTPTWASTSATSVICLLIAWGIWVV